VLQGRPCLFSFSRKAHMGISEINNDSVTRRPDPNPTWLDPERRQE
jgi:hypothetical protein